MEGRCKSEGRAYDEKEITGEHILLSVLKNISLILHIAIVSHADKLSVNLSGLQIDW